jgi:hypothetical protein
MSVSPRQAFSRGTGNGRLRSAPACSPVRIFSFCLSFRPMLLAAALEVPVTRSMEIVRERRGISRDLARLASNSGTRLEFLTKMPISYDRALASGEFWHGSKSGTPPPPGERSRKTAGERKSP